MTIFGKTPVKKLEQSVAEIKARVAKLGGKRDAAQRDLEAARAARQRHAIEGDVDDDAARSKLQTGVDRAASVLAGLNDAIAALAAQQAEAERGVAAEQLAGERKAASEALSQDVAAIKAQIAPWLDATRRLATDLEKLGTVRFDAGAIARFLTNAAGEAELAFAVCMPDLHGACAAIARGAEKIPRAEAAPAPIRAIAPPPPTERIFALRHISWTDPTSRHLMLGQRYSVCQMPPAAAERALEHGAAIRVDDERCIKLNGSWPHRPTRAEECLNLDSDVSAPVIADKLAAPSVVEPTRHSAFEPLDRGPVMTGRLPRERAAS
jgi:hypothetical protein